jgi:hypothetical protein
MRNRSRRPELRYFEEWEEGGPTAALSCRIRWRGGATPRPELQSGLRGGLHYSAELQERVMAPCLPPESLPGSPWLRAPLP